MLPAALKCNPQSILIVHDIVKTGKTFVTSTIIASTLAMTGCASTLFFPVRPAEKAADKVIDDIWPDVTKPILTKADAKKS